MNFWDGVYKKVSNAANYTAKETGRLSELAKVKYNLMREKSKLEDAYKEMGELYYNQMKNSEYDDKKIALAYDKIEKSLAEIERLNAQENAVNNTKVCTKCGEKLDKETLFCPKCGEELKVEEAAEAAEATEATEEKTEE